MHYSQHFVHRLLQECANTKELTNGRQVHSVMLSERLDTLSILGDHLIRLFALCGSLLEASLVFCKVANPSVYTWQAIISAHETHGESGRGLELYRKMQEQCTKPNRFIFICILKLCANLNARKQGERIHDQIIKSGLQSDVVIRSSLIKMYAKCGCIEKARKVFDESLTRNVVLWGAIIDGYVQHGHGLIALELFVKMQEEGFEPNKVIFLGTLKACGGVGCLGEGKLIHDQIIWIGVEITLVVGSALIDMYAKCGSLGEAQNLFDKLPLRDIVSWGAIIGGYVEHGHGIMALKLFARMQHEGMKPNKVLFICVLKACGSVEAFEQGKVVHAKIMGLGLESDVAVGSTLIDMYAKCGSLVEAQVVFDQMSNHNVVSWGAMIAGYVQDGRGHLALEFFELMQQDGIMPNKVTFSCAVKACASIGSLIQGQVIHALIIRSGLEIDVAMGSVLVDMYSKCGCMEAAHNLFINLRDRNVVACSVMVRGYAEHGCGLAALEVFKGMQEEGIQPNNITLLSVLKACGSIEDLELGKRIHEEITKSGFELDMALGIALMDMYAKCGCLEDSHNVFDKLPSRDTVAWGAMIEGYAQNHCGDLALRLFEKMQQEGKRPDKVSLLSSLKACGSVGALVQGKLINDHIIRSGFDSDEIVINSLMDMYAKCGRLEEAQNLFDEVQTRDVVSWGAMIGAYTHCEHGLLALQLFENMQREGIPLNNVIVVSILGACGSRRAIKQGRLIHEQIVIRGINSDKIVGNALIDMYAKCGGLEQAHKVFNELADRGIVSWGAMIVGYVQHGHGLPALQLFGRMQEEGIQVNEFIIPCILKACRMVGAIEQGMQIHGQILMKGLQSDAVVGSTLINMYARCGRMEEAREVLDRLPNRTVKSWFAMIGGYAEHGNGRFVKLCLEDMEQEGLQPHGSTFAKILSACVKAGKVEEGHQYFSSMKEGYGIPLRSEHFNCMVNLLGQAGYLEEAEELLHTMPIAPNVVGWTTLLSACKKYGTVVRGSECFNHAMLQEPNIASAFMLMSNICSDAHMWENVHALQDLRRSASAWKNPGRAWIEVNSYVHQFIVGEKIQSQGEKISANFKRFRRSMQVEGYVPQLDLIL